VKVLSYGMGTDSTGILARYFELGLQQTDPIDIILTADTGDGPFRPGERRRTYAYIDIVNAWLSVCGFPQITIVRKGGRDETLYENCIRLNMLPSLAYGFKGCSQKYKVEAQEKYLNNHPDAKAWWARGQLITKMIGYEHRENKRWSKAKRTDDKYEYEYPLVDWEWNRPECEAAILRVGLPLPGKSSCFFCPASTLAEIRDLRKNEPELFEMALAMEANFLATPDRACPECDGAGYVRPIITRPGTIGALVVEWGIKKPTRSLFPCACTKCAGTGRLAKTVKGLGRRFAWKDVDVAIAETDQVIEACRSCVDY
jgi:hypothetical protein